MGRLSVMFVGACGMVTVAGCGSNRQAPGSDAAIDDIAADVESEAGPTRDVHCGNLPFSVTAPAPEFLIVLDRSGSMNEDPTGIALMAGDPNTKWALMTPAIGMAVAQSETTVNWGLKFFGTGNSGCAVSNVVAVPPAPMTAAAITAAIAAPANQPATSTPTRAAEMTAGTYLAARATINPKYLLLVTDGEPNCEAAGGAASDATAAIAAVAAVAAMGIPTFVIGIAADGVAGTTLDQMAVMGGRPRMGTPQYYSVTTTVDLVEALNAIQSSVVGRTCTYPVGPVDPLTTDQTKITVTVDSIPSIQGDPDGWVYDPGMTSITFQGATCAQLMAGTLKTVQILFGCRHWCVSC